ncbi:MAG: hypothetical protein WCS35_06190 [Sphaerochaeta sp.]
MTILPILANIIVAVVISLLLWYAIQTIRKQGKEGGCGSCGKIEDGGEPSSACKGCAFASSCHIAKLNEEKK